MNIKKLIYLILGIFGMIMAFIAAIVPLLPSFPFVCLAIYGFSRSSKKFETWFINTSFYKNNFKSLIEDRVMTISAKNRSMFMVTILLLIASYFARKYFIALLLLLIIWVFHFYLFYIKIKTLNND